MFELDSFLFKKWCDRPSHRSKYCNGTLIASLAYQQRAQIRLWLAGGGMGMERQAVYRELSAEDEAAVVAFMEGGL